MHKTNLTREAFLQSLQSPSKEEAILMHEFITNHLSEVTQTVWQGAMWGGTEQTILGYGDITQKRTNKPDIEWFMIGLAQQKNYVSLYINAIEDGQYVAQKYKSMLGNVKVGSSSICFKRFSDINLKTLSEILQLASQQIS